MVSADKLFADAAKAAGQRAGVDSLTQMCAWFYDGIRRQTGSQELAQQLTSVFLHNLMRSASAQVEAGDDKSG